MSAPLTDEQIAQLAEDVNRAKMLHPGYRGPGDPIFDAADAAWETGPITVVGRQIDVYHVTIAVRVPADEAGRLPGFPGTQCMDDPGGDPPITGIDMLLGEAAFAAQDALERVLERSPLAADVRVGPGPDGGVVRVSVTYETPADRSF